MKAKTFKTKYCFIAILGILFTTVSCSDDFFNQQAGNRMNPDNHYQSLKDVELSLAAALIPLQEAMPNLIITDGLRSDLMDVTANADGNMRSILNEDFSADNPYLDPASFYKVIICANEILAHIDSVPNADPNFDEFYLFYCKGGIIGLRSWAYFNIVKIWGEAAYIPDNMPGISDDMTLEYISKSAMIDTLINQITPYIHTDESLVELRIGGYVNTKALLGELYLEKNDYANAVTYLKMGIESYGNSTSMYKVDKNFTKEGWQNIFINAESNQSENIAYISFKSTEGQRNPLTEMMLYNDKYMVKPSSKLVNTYLAQELLKGAGGDIYRGTGVTYDTIPGGETYISKYSLDLGEPYSTDIVISRAADLHLLLAEALNRSGDPTTALILLNAGMNAEKKKPTGYTRWAQNLGVRGRAYLKTLAVPVELIDPNSIMLYVEDLIIEERAMEMAFEGKRFTDLVRIAERRNDPDYLASRVSSKFSDEGTANTIREKLKNKTNWYLPFNK